MAPSSLSTVLVLSLLSFLSVGALARPGLHFHPCKSYYVSFSYTLSSPKTLDQIPLEPNPRPNLRPGFASNHKLPFSFFIYREINGIYPKPVEFMAHNDLYLVSRRDPSAFRGIKPYEREFRFTNSLRERTKDILSVIIALLFGLGCGALTSATMYLAWSLITNRYEGSASEEYEGADDAGYVKIPDTPSTDTVKKEGYEGK
ncbi:uncharacterized protein LOC18437667 [Amborella trichopoda]|uniref:Legume lectin domain-containing protein n=1 Tax=Amborella trichopoda TaxID=13333 RepID=W1PNX6_AMBTC|nr:uncharacterized protein LOC18437667 [Amborella trichopoda]ERN09514.1 hypothetical protein AMTR_s00029p00127080 [Amborella trichopoda]|eukprot:XP_006847933.1 uncharacterized protein LOC18437667 [Amborella trichopoda]